MANTPGVIAGPTSDVGIFLILGAVRNFGLGMRELVKGADLAANSDCRQLEKFRPARRRSGRQTFGNCWNGNDWQGTIPVWR